MGHTTGPPPDAQAAGAVQRRETKEQLRAGTTHPCTKEHLFQTGEYQLQDGQLSEPFEVNGDGAEGAERVHEPRTSDGVPSGHGG